MPVVELGFGVGYLEKAFSRSEGEDRACLLLGRGKAGEEENGSKSMAGNSVGAGRFTPAVEGRLGWALILLGVESIMANIYQRLCTAAEGFST